eukprot:gene5974-12051_t
MRLTTPVIGTLGGDSGFKRFECPDSGEGRSNNDSRLPKGDLMREISNTSKRCRKTVIESDDDDDMNSNHANGSLVPESKKSSEPWLEKVDRQSSYEIEKNKEIAKRNLRDLRLQRIPKRIRLNTTNNDDDDQDSKENHFNSPKPKDSLSHNSDEEWMVETPDSKSDNRTSLRDQKTKLDEAVQRRKQKIEMKKRGRNDEILSPITKSIISKPKVSRLVKKSSQSNLPDVNDNDNDNDESDSDQNSDEDNINTPSENNNEVIDLADDDNNSDIDDEDHYDTTANLTSIQVDESSHRNGEMLVDRDIRKLCPGLELKEYQMVGVNWLKLLHQNKVNGVLADDMGLGKTVQTIAFLGWLHYHYNMTNTRHRPHLIIVPASTISNWVNELKRFCPSLIVILYHGTQNERYILRKQIKKDIECNKFHIILSTYTIFERESGKDDCLFLRSHVFEYLILDEAHCLKNSSSQRYSQLKKLQSKHRLLLSGTPVQNDIKELLSLLSFLMPQVFNISDCTTLINAINNIKDFNSYFSTENDTNGTATTTTKKNKNNKQLSNTSNIQLSIVYLRKMLAPFVLRRLKRNVLHQLVAKENSIEMLCMTSSQQKIYDDIIIAHTRRKHRLKTLFNLDAAYSSNNIIDMTEDKQEKYIDVTDDVEVKDEIDVAVSGNIAEDTIRELSTSEANSLFTALRKAANHPLLLRIHFQDPNIVKLITDVTFQSGYFGSHCTVDMVREEIENMSDFDLNRLCVDYPRVLGHLQLDGDVLYDSPKMQKLKDILPKLAKEGHRMLIFSQWTRILDLLEVLAEDIDMPYLRLDGSTPVKERQNLIDRFNSEDIPIFFLATKAGGLGINLTAADTVILHDLDFNPENDRQAEVYVYIFELFLRQTRPVRVIRLVTTGTVDEDIYDMAERKKRLSSAVLSDDPNTTGPNGDQNDNKLDMGHILKKALERAMNKK